MSTQTIKPKRGPNGYTDTNPSRDSIKDFTYGDQIVPPNYRLIPSSLVNDITLTLRELRVDKARSAWNEIVLPTVLGFSGFLIGFALGLYMGRLS